jgi:hypothetical protein
MLASEKPDSYGTSEDTKAQVKSLATRIVKENLPKLMEFSKEKLHYMRTYAEEGDWSWRAAGVIAGFLLMIMSAWNFIDHFFSLSWFHAIIDIYLFFCGALAFALENRDRVFTERYRKIIKREALFLYKPYGRAAFYICAGIVVTGRGGMSALLVGLFITFVGAVIYYYSREAENALSNFKNDKMDEASVVLKFREFDRDNNGFLDSHELGLLCASLGRPLNRKGVETALFMLDQNCDGKVSLDEFLMWWSNHDDYADLHDLNLKDLTKV